MAEVEVNEEEEEWMIEEEPRQGDVGGDFGPRASSSRSGGRNELHDQQR